MTLTTEISGRIIFKLGPNPQIPGKTTHRLSFLENRVLVTASIVRSGEYFNTYLSEKKGKANGFAVVIISFPHIITRNRI
jgi:hypothetical protein